MRSVAETFAFPADMLINDGPQRSEQQSELACHLDHRAAKSELREQALSALVLVGGAEDDTRRTVLAQPLHRCFHQRRCGSGAAIRFLDQDVVNEATGVA